MNFKNQIKDNKVLNFKVLEFQKLKLASVASVEPDAMELLSVDEELVAMSATSVLYVDIKMISPGSESEYIPDVYKPLYIKKWFNTYVLLAASSILEKSIFN